MTRLFLGTFLMILIHANVGAHGMKVFATVSGNTIKGSVFFIGGSAAQGVTVRLLADGADAATTKTDTQGRFTFTTAARTDHVVVAETADGHQARYALPASSFSGGGAAPAQQPSGDPSPEGIPATSVPAAVSVGETERKIDALRNQLLVYESRTRIRDVLGGIGYILGIMGVILYFKAQKRQRETGKVAK